MERIDACIDTATADRLLFDSDDIDSIGLNHAKGVLPFMHAHRHGRSRLVQIVKVQQLTVLDVRNDIAIGHNKAVLGLGAEQAERTSRSQRRFLAQVFDVNAKLPAVAEVLFDHVAQVKNRNYKMLKTLGLGPLDNVLQHGLTRDGQHGFGAAPGMRP